MIALAFLYFTQYMATKKAIELGKAKDDLSDLKDKKAIIETEIKITKVKANSEEKIAQVKADADEQIASLTVETNKAKKEIAQAQAIAAQANAEAAKANEAAETERRVRVKMETDLAPRVIITADKEISELNLFSGTGVIIQFEPYDNEAFRLAGQIGAILRKANWNIFGFTPENTINYGSAGVTIYSQRTGEARTQKSDNRWNDAAKVLNYQLVENKIDTVEFTVRPQAREFPSNFPIDAILVVVGSKPQPYFTDKQWTEIQEKMGIRKDIEERKHKQEQRMEEDFKKIPDPELQKLLEESKQRKESIVDIWDRRGRESYKEYQKAIKEKIIQKYKQIN